VAVFFLKTVYIEVTEYWQTRSIARPLCDSRATCPVTVMVTNIITHIGDQKRLPRQVSPDYGIRCTTLSRNIRVIYWLNIFWLSIAIFSLTFWRVARSVSAVVHRRATLWSRTRLRIERSKISNESLDGSSVARVVAITGNWWMCRANLIANDQNVLLRPTGQ